jgi:hypothetical protein
MTLVRPPLLENPRRLSTINLKRRLTRGPRVSKIDNKTPPAGLSLRADARTRTGDPFITSEVLYQLSYVGGARRYAAAPV